MKVIRALSLDERIPEICACCARLIIAPNGTAYAPPEARPGILPRLLQEILSTRIMVKAAMKRAPKSAKVSARTCDWAVLCTRVLGSRRSCASGFKQVCSGVMLSLQG